MCNVLFLLLGFRNPKLRDTSLSLSFFLSFFLSSFPFSLPKKTRRRLERFRFCVRHCKVFCCFRHKKTFKTGDFLRRRRREEEERASSFVGRMRRCCSREDYACESRAFLCLSGSENTTNSRLLVCPFVSSAPPKNGDKSQNRRRGRRRG